MPKTRQQKQELLKNLTEKLKKAKSLVFVNFDKLKVKEVEKFRKICRQENIDYLVVKKTLMKLALTAADAPEINLKSFEKGIGIIFGYNDEIAPARIAESFSKEHQNLQSLGGILENKFIDKIKILELSKLPTREELLAKLVGSLSSPLSGLVGVLSGNLRSLVQVLKAIRENK